MRLVVDANILFSALLKDSTTRKLLSRNDFFLYAPIFIMEEFNKHRKDLAIKSGLSEEELNQLVKFLIDLSALTIVSSQELLAFNDTAKRISPDPDDMQYFALAMKLKAKLWSEDKRLKKQSTIQVLSTKELIGNIM